MQRLFKATARLTLLSTVALGIANTAWAQAPERAATPPAVARACPAEMWGAPRELLTRDDKPVYVEAANAVRAFGRVALIGTPTFIWHSPSVLFDSASIAASAAAGRPVTYAGVMLDGSENVTSGIPLPTRDGQMLAPRAVTETGGRVHFIWGTSPDSSPMRYAHVTALWHAEFDGRAWSTPVRIRTAAEISWMPTTSKVFAASSALWVVAPRVDTTGGALRGGLVVLRLEKGRWTSSEIVTSDFPPSYATLAHHHGSAIVAFIGSATQGISPDDNGLFVTQQDSPGDRWSRPMLIRSLGRRAGSDPHLLSGAEGRLHLLWLTSGRRRGGDDSLHVAISDDHGRTWARAASYAHTGGLNGLRVAVDREHTLHLVVRDGRTGELLTATGKGLTWSRLVRLPFGSAATQPSIMRLGSDSLLLAWGVVRDDRTMPGTQLTPVLKFSVRRAPCAR